MNKPELNSISISCELIIDFLITATENFYKECYQISETKRDDIFFSEKGAMNYLSLIKSCIASKSWEVFTEESESFLNKKKINSLEVLFSYSGNILKWTVENKKSKFITDDEYMFVQESLCIYHKLCKSIITNPYDFRNNYIEEIENYQRLFVQSLKKE